MNNEPHNLEKEKNYNLIMTNLPMYSSYDLSTPINYEYLQQKSFDIPPKYYIEENVGQSHLDLLKSLNYFDNRIDDDFYHRLSRKKRRIIYFNNKFDPLAYTPKRHVKKDIKNAEAFEKVAHNKIDNNQEKNYQVYDTESDVNHVPNHLWSYIPVEKSRNGGKGHGYLIFGKRYSFYVSVDQTKASKSSSTSKEQLVEREDDLSAEDNNNYDHTEQKEDIQTL